MTQQPKKKKSVEKPKIGKEFRRVADCKNLVQIDLNVPRPGPGYKGVL